MKTTNLFSGYQFEDTVKAELNNNLTIINEIIGKSKISNKPEFYILGGAALVFHDLDYNATLDIDTANRIHSDVKSLVDDFIDDAASEVSILAFNYKTRAQKIREDLKNINIYILSEEDLFITKALSGRRKDYNSLIGSGITKRINKNLLISIAKSELEVEHTVELIRIIGSWRLKWN